MQLSRASSRAVRATSARSTRSVLVAKASSQEPLSAPEWLPAQAKPALDFFNSTDASLESVTTTITSSDVYNKYAKDIVESQWTKDSLGWKSIPETVNGRAAMLGFLAAALAEIFGAGSVLNQLASGPQAVLLTLAAITAGSIIPLVKGKDGDYTSSLLDTYSLPSGVFTQANERVHGRVAMLGLVGLIVVELFIGRALL